MNGDWRNYLTGLIISSPLYDFRDTEKPLSPNCKITVDENPKLATLKLSCEMQSSFEPSGLSDLKYSMESTPGRWVYELIPSANIEGAFVVQDLQMQTQPRQKFSMSTKTSDASSALAALSGYMWIDQYTGLLYTYIESGTNYKNVKAFLLNENFITGLYDASYNIEFIGNDRGISSGTLLKLIAKGTSATQAPIRKPNYNFGY